MNRFNKYDGYRIYNGCPDSTMQRRLDYEASQLKELKKLVPEAHVTYFPVEEKFQAHVWGKSLSGMCGSRIGAIQEAIRNNS